MENWFYEVVERFRQKGAISPGKAMSAQELSLPPRFELAMKRRLGRIGVFVEVNGKYYLSEERLKQIEGQRSARDSSWNLRRRMLTLRTIQVVAVGLFLSLFVANIFVESWELRVISILLLVIWLVISMLQIYYLWRIRKRTFSRKPLNQIMFRALSKLRPL